MKSVANGFQAMKQFLRMSKKDNDKTSSDAQVLAAEVPTLTPEEQHAKWLRGKVKQFDEVMALNRPDIDVKDLLDTAKKVTFLYENGAHAFRGHNIQITLDDKEIRYLNDDNWQDADVFICMAYGIETPHEIMEAVKELEVPVLVCEETFLRSITPSSGCPDGCPAQFLDAVSHLFDARSPHFYLDQVSSLEKTLNSDLVIDDEAISFSQEMLTKIVDAHLSKYNSQPISEPILPNNGKRNVLVIDQVKGDMAITFNGGSQQDFTKMLQAAINENPDCNVIVKTHVDKRKGNFDESDLNHPNVHVYADPINMLSLLDCVDKVYVFSSGAGIEAIWMNKETHVFGSPIYAGWGLTQDRKNLARRTQKRSREELFYIVFVLFSRYCNPLTGKSCDLAEAVDALITLRQQYFKTYNIASL